MVFHLKETTMNTVENLEAHYPMDAKPLFEKRVAALKKKLTSMGVNLIEGPTRTELLSGVKTNVQRFHVAYGESDLKYVGRVTNQEGVLSMFSVDNTSLKDFKDVNEQTCVVCNKKHGKRKHIHVFKKDDELITVGSTCTKKYVNVDVQKLTNALESFTQRNNVETLTKNYKGYYDTVSTQQVLMATIKAHSINNKYVKDNGFYGYNEQTPTKQLVENNMEYYKNPEPTDLIRAKVTKGLLKEYFNNVDESNNFKFTMKETLFNEGELLERIPYRAMGRLVFAIYEAIKLKHSELNPSLSEYVGTLGEELTTELKLISMKDYTNYNFSYYGSTSTLIKMEDRDNNIVSFFTSSNKVISAVETLNDDEFIKLKGMVTAQKKYGRDETTSLKRVKVVKKC